MLAGHRNKAIRLNELQRLDLNLLVTLDALLSERHVTRAAAMLHLSQPAVSVRLAKLRAFFGDPLLISGSSGMLTTTRADALREPLHAALGALRSAVLPAPEFEPSMATRTWSIAATDYGGLAVVLPTITHVRRLAPLTRLAVVEVAPQRTLKQFESGEIDIALQMMGRKAFPLHFQKLFDEHYVLVGRKGHPGLGNELNLEQFCSLEHVMVSPDGGGFNGPTDIALQAMGLVRKVVLSLPHFMVVLSTIESTDLVAMLPYRVAKQASNLQIVNAPLAVPGYEMGMVWHDKCDRDPAHRWIRSQIMLATMG